MEDFEGLTPHSPSGERRLIRPRRAVGLRGKYRNPVKFVKGELERQIRLAIKTDRDPS